LIVYLSFAATGLCMALPGSVLPALLIRWSLADSEAGLLFFLAWMGSSVGALVVRAPISRSLACGAILLAFAAFGMAYGDSSFRWITFAWMTLFGIGLGMTMTATSILQASRNADRRGLELNRLNLVWAIGASICPTLAEHSLRITDVRSIFSAVGVFFVLIFVWTIVFERDPAPVAAASTLHVDPKKRKWTLALWPLPLVILIFLPTGIESSMGGWIAAYVQRSQQTLSTTVTAGSCFWIGLLLSRTFSSFILRRSNSETFVLRQSMVTLVFGISLLIASYNSLGILVGVFLIGYGLGPIYPLLLAVALQYSDNTLIFFVAGLGSASLPWLTGVTSSAASSLRMGLWVPLLASLVLLFLGLRRFHPQADHPTS
jgi:fucose permease